MYFLLTHLKAQNILSYVTHTYEEDYVPKTFFTFSTYFWFIYVIVYLIFVNVIEAYVYMHAHTANNIFWSLEKNTLFNSFENHLAVIHSRLWAPTMPSVKTCSTLYTVRVINNESHAFRTTQALHRTWILTGPTAAPVSCSVRGQDHAKMVHRSQLKQIVLREQNWVCRCWNHQNWSSRIHQSLHVSQMSSRLTNITV